MYRIYNAIRTIKIPFTRSKRLSSSFCARSHTCGELNDSNVGERVTLYGWVQFQRMNKFLTLRDSYGSTQVILPPKFAKLKPESVVKVSGSVAKRPEGLSNSDMKTGNIEIIADDVELLNECPQTPFSVHDNRNVNEDTRLKHRYLDIRSAEMQKRLRMRSKLLFKMREFLCEKHNFVDVETPTLFRKTPGGAREFIIPSHTVPNHFYSLPQSPQQFKQLLMVGGIDRYMQIARCYRDETTRPDRQPEFTQLDLEMSFVDSENIMNLTEEMLKYSLPFELETPIPRYDYGQVMIDYGTDKPDLRIPYKIENIPQSMPKIKHETIKFIKLEGATNYLEEPQLKELMKYASDFQGREFRILQTNDAQNSIHKIFNSKPEDIILMATGSVPQVCSLLGNLRVASADLLEKSGCKVRSSDYRFAWIKNFPLFEKNDGKFESAHHPFTAPQEKDEHLVYTDPIMARGNHYDLVLNGFEVGGGSIRNHKSTLQRYIIEEILKEDSKTLDHLLTALDMGAPPHGGIALGLDRLVAVLCNVTSIKEVIAFPKTNEGRDLMSCSPAPLSKEDADYYLKDYISKKQSEKPNTTT
ncbi:DgyrCDS7533 [Dimorphilus gyrociliatus]|uniref:DgyrCDS7533 n=1 Tax=Dimorphilus gyrociliatus TaxID=2664684 RepID=A0A7I8VT03_9ANNE|nr:DgyrCDS7533 [Dimorphilus gyrociliatus]